MQTQFTEKELGDCLELVIDHRGKTPKKLGADWIDAGIPTISAKNVNGGRLVSRESIRYVSFDVYKRWMKEDVKRGDCFLVSEGATLGECMLWDYDYPIVLGQRIFCLRSNPAILNPRFLYAYMTSRSFQEEIIGRATGTSVDGLRQTEVLKLKLRLPPIGQQKLIGDVLYNLDHKIELNQRMNATLEAMAWALFQSWFVDFDPVRAKLDGRPPSALDPATAALFPDSFQDSMLGSIPQGWRVAYLEEIASIGSGKRPERRCDVSSPECNIPLYGGGGRMGYVPSSLYEKPILFTGRVGTLGLIFRTAEPSWPSDNTLIVEPQAGFFDFTYFVLKGFDLITLNRGSTQPLLTQTDLKRQTFVLPTKDVVKAFADVSEPIFQQMASNERESQTLTTLRDTLLPKLLNGELAIEVKK